MEEININESWKDRVYRWANTHANTTKAKVILSVWSFSESSFFLIPVDIMLVSMLLVGAGRWVYLSSITTLASVAGGIFGYFIGFAFFDLFGQKIIDLYHLQEEFFLVNTYFEKNAFVAVLISAFTPVPYKLFTISGGLFKIPFIPFTVASLIGRGLRFFLVGYIAQMYGEKVLALVLRYFRVITILIIILVALYILLF